MRIGIKNCSECPFKADKGKDDVCFLNNRRITSIVLLKADAPEECPLRSTNTTHIIEKRDFLNEQKNRRLKRKW